MGRGNPLPFPLPIMPRALSSLFFSQLPYDTNCGGERDHCTECCEDLLWPQRDKT